MMNNEWYFFPIFYRHRQSVESKYVAKLNLDELERFNEQVNNLPCRIKESSLIEVIVTCSCSYVTYILRCVATIINC